MTDTFGTPTFLRAFKKQIPQTTTAVAGGCTTLTSAAATTEAGVERVSEARKRYADVFTGVRQDSGDPLEFVKMMRDFYDGEGIKDKKTIVFSDSLNLELCFKYKAAAEAAGFQPTFGVGTFLTSAYSYWRGARVACIADMCR